MIWHGMAYIAVSGCFGMAWHILLYPDDLAWHGIYCCIRMLWKIPTLVRIWKQVTTNQYKGFEKQGRHFEKWMNFDTVPLIH